MKHTTMRKTLSLLLVAALLMTMLPAPSSVRAVEALSTNVKTPFTGTTKIPDPSTGGTTTSGSYRIPSMVTLNDGTIVAAADVRWNTTYDGGGLDTLVARSTDGGLSWEYTMANYLGDNGNAYNGKLSTCFIDPCLTVAADGQTVYMLCDLYPYGVALNGNGQQTAPDLAVGFNDQGYLKLSYGNSSSYGYYLKEGKIYSNAGVVQSDYTVDAYFNVYEKGTKISNLFYSDSPYKVVRTGFLYLTHSSDGGKTWSEPQLLNLKTSSEQVCLVGPGRGITTKDGTMVFPVYSYNGSESSQRMGFVYYNEAEGWQRVQSDNAWSSEAAVVEIGQGTLRFFYRNGTTNLTYVDYNMTQKTWGNPQSTGIKINSNTQLSAITYSKTVNGKQVILVSCPKGPTGSNGSSSSNGSNRLNGHIYVGVVESATTMTWTDAINVSGTNTASALSGSNYTATQGFFAYSCLTERADGSIAILYENQQNGWGAGDGYGYAMNMKAYGAADLGLTFDEGSGSGGVTPDPDVPVDGNEITLQVGQTVKLSVSDTEAVGTAGTFTSANGNVQYVVKHFQTTSGYQKDTDGIDSGKKYLLVCSGNYAVTTSSSSVNPWSTESLPLTPVAFDNSDTQHLWTITATNGGYYIRRSDGQYMNITNQKANGENRIVVLSDDPVICDITPSGNGYMIFRDGTNIGLNNAGGEAYNQTALGWPSNNNTVWTLYEYIPQGGTEVEITGLGVTAGTDVTIGTKTYTVIVESKDVQLHTNLRLNSSQILDALTTLGLSGSDYTVTYTETADENGVVTINGNVVNSASAEGQATILATVTNAQGEIVGTVTYVVTVADLLITDVEQVFVAVGSKAMISGLSGEVNTSLLESGVVSLDQANGAVLDGDTLTITAENNAANIGKHTSILVGTTQFVIHLVPGNALNTDANKYIYVEITELDHCEVYFAINGSELHQVEGTGALIDETFYDGFNLMFFAIPDEGYILTEMTSVEVEANGNQKTLTDFYSLANGTRADGTDSDAWPLENADATAIPTDSNSGEWKFFLNEKNEQVKHGFRWSLLQGNMDLGGMRDLFTRAKALGAKGVTTVTKNEGAGIRVSFSFKAEELPTFEKTIISVNNKPYSDDAVIEFGDELVYQFTVTTTSEDVKYTSIVLKDEAIGFSKTISDGTFDTPGTYTYTATYTVKQSDVDKYTNGKFVNKATLDFIFTSDYDTGDYEFTSEASVSCDISGMVYYTWADNVPAGITGNATVYPLPGQEVVTYNQPFQVKPYTGAKEYVAVENGVAVGKWTFKGWSMGTDTYNGGETVNMSSQGSLAFKGVWEYTAYPTYTVTYQWVGAPTTGVTLPTDGGNYYSGQTYRVDGTYTPGHTFTVDGVEYTFNGWELNGSPVSGQQTMSQSNVILVGEWSSSQLYTSLTIHKTGYAAYVDIDTNQTFLFHIQGEGVDLVVAVHGDGSVVVDGLKVGGTYTVTEITAWSWRYGYHSYDTELLHEAVAYGASVTLGNGSNEITFTNERTVKWWLDGDHWIDNLFNGQS